MWVGGGGSASGEPSSNLGFLVARVSRKGWRERKVVVIPCLSGKMAAQLIP
jgi:hypothetical protein